ncbi:protein O-mannosyl-transferase 2-like [Mercenaria mercenaria]|uniref:protein O-mannosyl-transferase 2-like n=1 Tax=Mercenaria mercenaria TaxID=6596 RepID=UPI00234E69A0|nr:protein O-mannosyl-transferase 2-like [Mercenaria mercenaria]
MSEKVSGIPVKRKTNSPGNNQEKGGQTSNNKSSNPVTEIAGYSSSDKAHSDLNKSKEMAGTKYVLKSRNETKNNDGERTTGNGIKDSVGDTSDSSKNLDLGNDGVASLSYNSDQNVLYYAVLTVVTVLAFVTRLYKLEVPSWVCWDETHFGKMGSWYINHTFFFDVHPPLGKMLIGLAGHLSGYEGTFAFNKPGDEYGDIPYMGMRAMCACMGAALVPLVYMSTWLLCQSVTASLLASSFVLFELGINTLTRYILLDPILMFFIMASTYTLLKFLWYKDSPFSLSWWFWLSATGVFLSCAIAVKFVGLFVVLLAGYSTIADLWRLLGNHKLPLIEIIKHFVARAACLIVLPVICYMIFFAIHFAALYKSGHGDGFYSSQFQSTLEGNRLHNISMPDSFAYGSVVSLKHQRTGGTYLHSHPHLYPEEHPPRQQQITGYSHKDENNMWRIKPSHYEPSEDNSYPVFVKNGDLVRLEHIHTRRNLHSHREPAPLTSRHFQVSGYGQDGKGDANDIWQIVVPGVEEGAQIRVVQSKFKLIHYHVKCALFAHDKKLPKWGFEQQEITCNPDVKAGKTLWSVEEIRDKRLPDVSFEVHKPSFLDKFIESHAVMTQGNAGLKPQEGEVTSRPWQWPINLRGQVFSGKDHRVYLLGNPIIFYGLLVVMALFFLIYLVHSVKVQRGVKMTKEVSDFKERTFSACWWAMIGWSLHYFTFWPMTRVLYFHHYFPALLYGFMLGGITLDYMIKMLCNSLPRSLSVVVFHTCIGILLSGTAYSFYLFHPLTYGMSGPQANNPESNMYGLKWLDTWEI